MRVDQKRALGPYQDTALCSGPMHEPAVSTRIRAYFERHAGSDVVCVYLFGSTARGEARADSDLDIAVLYRTNPPHTLEGAGVSLAGEVERATERPVDVVVLNRAPVDLVHRVLRDGILVYETDPSARIAFEVRSRNIDFDLKPILEHYRRGKAKTLHG